MSGANCTAHGFRSSFVEWARAKGIDADARERCLAHAITNAVEAAYARLDLLEQRKPAMERWVDHCVGGSPTLDRFIDQGDRP